MSRKSEIQALVREATALLDKADELKAMPTLPNVPPLSGDIGRQLGPPGGHGHGYQPAGSGPGDVFVRSAGYKSIRDPSARTQQWSSGLVDIPPLEYKGTLSESTVGGPGGGLVPPDYRPGIVRQLFEPLSVMDLLPSVSTTGSQIRYVLEGTALSGARGIGELGEKPESALQLSEVTEAIRKVATLLPVSDELLEDGASVQAYLNSRLNLFVAYEEERQVLRGSGSGSNELLGIFSRDGLMTYGRGTVDNNAVAILKAAAGYRGTICLDADLLVMHPDNALATRLLTDSTGQFLAGGPYLGQYGQGQVLPMLNAPLWGLNVAISSTVGKGTALLGSTQAVQIFRRGGRSIEASNSHGSNFAYNITALRCESRLGLAVYRPFVQVTGLA